MDILLLVLEIKSKILVLDFSLNTVNRIFIYLFIWCFRLMMFDRLGDGGVDISPIGDLMKSEVRAIARELGIDRSIIDAAPTDGLFGDMRTDEAQIGATYDELEWAMKQQEKGKESDQEQMNERQAKVMKIYLQRHQANKHKMEEIPICIIPKELKQSASK